MHAYQITLRERCLEKYDGPWSNESSSNRKKKQNKQDRIHVPLRQSENILEYLTSKTQRDAIKSQSIQGARNT